METKITNGVIHSPDTCEGLDKLLRRIHASEWSRQRCTNFLLYFFTHIILNKDYLILVIIIHNMYFLTSCNRVSVIYWFIRGIQICFASATLDREQSVNI